MGKASLVILAAGLGTRFGGLKQMQPVGPCGEAIIDYSVFDAARTGFDPIIFVIRPDMQAEFQQTVVARLARHADVRIALQRMEDLPPGFVHPPGRTRPWGTGHAVLAAASRVSEPFAVINADDFYGRQSFQIMHRFLNAHQSPGPLPCALVGYRLRSTLSDHGGVARAVCMLDTTGLLVDIVETLDLEPNGADARQPDAAGGWRSLPGDTLVSMNFWGFPRALFPLLEQGLTSFLAGPHSADREYQLPTALHAMSRAGTVQIAVLPTSERWCGLTHPADFDTVAAAISAMVRAEVYPERLWK